MSELEPIPESDPDASGLERDRQRAEVLRQLGPDHRHYVKFGRDLRDYGIGTLMKLHHAGTLHETVQRKTKLPALPPAPPSWTTHNIRSIVAYSVARSVEPFLQSAIMEGNWDAEGGTRLKVFFVGRCCYAYRDDYCRERKEEIEAARLLRHDGPDPDLELDVVNYVHQLPSPDPLRTAVDRAEIRRLLAMAPDQRLPEIVFLQSAGMSVEEIANQFHMTTTEVHNVLRRLRRMARRRTT